MRVLMVEDERDLKSMYMGVLRSGGFAVDPVETLSEAHHAHETVPYDMILLDRMLPDGDGISFLKTIRRKGSRVPVIIMTAERRLLDDRVEGLDSGADDYLQKPVYSGEMLARIRAVLRRHRVIHDDRIVFGNLHYDPATSTMLVDDQPLQLPRRELRLLELLLRRRDRTVTREAIENSLYSLDDAFSDNAIEVCVHRLRTALARAGASVRIDTVRGIGYVLRQ
jgi:DNA-binding response OmpR family regulator